MVKSRLLLLVTLLAVLTAGCTVEIGMLSSSVNRQMQARYTYFDGMKSKSVPLQQGDSLLLNFEAVVESGSLMLRLRDPDRDVIWEKQYPASKEDYRSAYTLEVPRTGSYRMEVEADQSQGSFNLSWEAQ